MPTTITFNEYDFAPDPASPIESDFTLPPSGKSDIEENPAVALVHCKQHKLSVLHEIFGHLSFSIVKIMARKPLVQYNGTGILVYYDLDKSM